MMVEAEAANGWEVALVGDLAVLATGALNLLALSGAGRLGMGVVVGDEARDDGRGDVCLWL